MQRFQQYQFLFEELVKRDFKHKYKRTFLGVLWSLISPLAQLLVLNVIFVNFFGHKQPHYTVYLFTGLMVFTYFSDATTQGMRALDANSYIISKINVPKYLFVFSRIVSSLINFALTMVIYLVFVAVDQIPFTFRFFMLLYPVVFLTLFNIGMALILSALHIFFKDLEYLYSIFTMLVMYASAIFYSTETFSASLGKFFYLNPVYDFILYFRTIVIGGAIPSLSLHLICAGFGVGAFMIGLWMYKKYNYKFLYYM
ncbi:MAG: ABC transporter permease [Candidatus Limiplasma sp.]|nr:ABC transporter permease [Candidatus Limiplasma sp.]MEA5144885.1 ABC transporter permease [Candidatus Limiplasma sp.]